MVTSYSPGCAAAAAETVMVISAPSSAQLVGSSPSPKPSKLTEKRGGTSAAKQLVTESTTVNDAVTDPFGSTVPLSGLIGEMSADADVARASVTIAAPASHPRTLDLVRAPESGRRDIGLPSCWACYPALHVETTFGPQAAAPPPQTTGQLKARVTKGFLAGGRFSRTASFSSRREEELGGVFAWAILIAYVLMLAQPASFGEAALLGSFPPFSAGSLHCFHRARIDCCVTCGGDGGVAEPGC